MKSTPGRQHQVKVAVHVLVILAGFAALSWEVVWQLKTALALGISASGTAITLATTMGGMSAGSALAGRFLQRRSSFRPLRLYAACEAVIGLCGLVLHPGMRMLEQLDTGIFQAQPGIATPIHVLGLALLLGLPALAMGATIPILGLVAQDCGASLPKLYGLNTAGAAFGCLFLAFTLLPAVGVLKATLIVACLNFLVAALAVALAGAQAARQVEAGVANEVSQSGTSLTSGAVSAAFLTGFITFSLEVAWFRSLRSVFWSTSESFAIMLSAVLIALALGAHLAPLARRRGYRFELFLASAGVAVLLATPALERITFFTLVEGEFVELMLSRFFGTFLVIGPPVTLLGMVLPWLLDDARDPSQWSRLYGFNTLGALAGSLGTAWLILPALGLTKTSWLAGLLLLGLALCYLQTKARTTFAALGAVSLMVAMNLDTGIGRTRVQGRSLFPQYTITTTVDTPDACISLIETPEGNQALVIDGFVAAETERDSTHYMPWMGHLPMILAENPEDALIICFGTGQTTNGVRREEPKNVDVVDINRRVFELGPLFRANENVLADPRVTSNVMDGRAWMRRTTKKYDVITLEPMPPNFSGVNSLYSREFYQAARDRLKPGGVVAQWLPFHLVAPKHSCSIAKTFQETFPNSALWLDPVGFTGVLVGTNAEKPISESFPGLSRNIPRSLTAEQVRRSMTLDADGMTRLGSHGDVITDDNQLLNHGLWKLHRGKDQGNMNLAIVHWASVVPPPEVISAGTLYQKLRIQVEDLQPVPPYKAPGSPRR